MSGQWHLDADSYLRMVRAEIPSYDDLQDRLAEATADVEVAAILDLGSGTGVTAARVLARHAASSLIGIDSCNDMLGHAQRTVPRGRFLHQRLEEPLPTGPFDLVVSAFAIHHLPSRGKRELFARVAAVLQPRGRFVFCDVVLPTGPVSTPVPIEAGIDLPDTVADQLQWLTEADLKASIVCAEGDLAILRGDRI
jgi:trans-aconitate methyltransferase